MEQSDVQRLQEQVMTRDAAIAKLQREAAARKVEELITESLVRHGARTLKPLLTYIRPRIVEQQFLGETRVMINNDAGEPTAVDDFVLGMLKDDDLLPNFNVKRFDQRDNDGGPRHIRDDDPNFRNVTTAEIAAGKVRVHSAPKPQSELASNEIRWNDAATLSKNVERIARGDVRVVE